VLFAVTATVPLLYFPLLEMANGRQAGMPSQPYYAVVGLMGLGAGVLSLHRAQATGS
jgi:hypothetical protein